MELFLEDSIVQNPKFKRHTQQELGSCSKLSLSYKSVGKYTCFCSENNNDSIDRCGPFQWLFWGPSIINGPWTASFKGKREYIQHCLSFEVVSWKLLQHLLSLKHTQCTKYFFGNISECAQSFRSIDFIISHKFLYTHPFSKLVFVYKYLFNKT